MYLTSFVHRKALFGIAERWLCNRLEPDDARRLTEILICDGFIISETLMSLAGRLLDVAHGRPFHQRRINLKGELRDLICLDEKDSTPRVKELFVKYRENPDYYYREAPISGVMCLDDEERLLGLFRVKRPKRIAEKANRRIAEWIFENVRVKAMKMAEERARLSGVPFERFVTPPEEMMREFVHAEEVIARSFRDGEIRLDRNALTIHDVGGFKVVSDGDGLKRLEAGLASAPDIDIVEREDFSGNYQAVNLVLQVPWDAEHVCRRYSEGRAWERYLGRGIAEGELMKGLEPFLTDAEPRINIELILSTFPDMVESELGSSIHEERIIKQRDNIRYRGNIPMNVEFLVESLFAVGFSPRTDIDRVPIRLWGRYLPETMGSYVRKLYSLPEHDLFN